MKKNRNRKNSGQQKQKPYNDGKRWKKPYSRSRVFDASCRDHGSCPACAGARGYKRKRQEPLLEDFDEILLLDTTEENDG